MCLKDDTSQLNLPHGNDNSKQWKNRKSKKRICSEVSVNSPQGIHVVSPEEEKKGCGEKD